LADRIPVDTRRLATQLRRMKDRSGLTVPALAARTAQSAEAWELVLAGRQLPPLDAVEVLAQASGADYERIGALWHLAEKAGTASGDRGRGKPVPYPDPLDPLGAEEGLPGGNRRMLLLVTAGVLAAVALIAVLLTAGTSTGRAPRENAGPTESASVAPSGGSQRGGSPGGSSDASSGGSSGGTDASGGSGSGGGTGSAASGGNPGTDMGGSGGQSSAALGSTSPSPGGVPSGPATSAPPASSAPADGGTGSGDTGSGGTGSGGGTPSDPPTSPTPSPTQTQSGLCLGVILLNICVG
jgi:hypothetical protein